TSNAGSARSLAMSGVAATPPPSSRRCRSDHPKEKPMKKHSRYPHTLISFQHLEGGTYGTLSMIARDRDTMEVRLGSDFVRIDADGASQIAQAIESFVGTGMVLEVEAETVEETEVVVEEPRAVEPRLGRPRRPARR